MNIQTYLRKRGYQGVDSAFRGKIDEWLQWYQGDVESFHRYSIYNGVDFVEKRRKTVGMAKTISEDWANLILNDKTQISTGNFKNSLQDILRSNRWDTQSARLIELSFALGTGALVEYIGDNGRPNIDYIRADMIYPLSWENGIITECAFGSKKTISGKECVYLQLHLLSPTEYIIENHLFDEKTEKEMELEKIPPVVHTNSPSPLFQIITPNITNNVDLDCPMGISIYANALSVLQSLDLVYDSYYNEFDLGRKRVFLPMSMARIELSSDVGGKQVMRPVFDTSDTTFYALQGEGQDKNKPVELNMALRAQEHELALQTQLNILSEKCGMGKDRYRFGGDGVKTATEVISEKSDLYQNLKKHERLLTDALIGMVKALACLSGAPEPEVTVQYDDGIINDDNTKIDNNIKLVQAELKSKLSAIMDVYGFSEADAQKELDRIIEENRGVSGADFDLFGGEPMQQRKIGFPPGDENEGEAGEE